MKACDIAVEDSKPGQGIVAGSVSGGIMFQIEKGIVPGMFVGAAAE